MKNLLTNIRKRIHVKNPSFYWGGIVLFLTVIILGIVNYKSGTILTGWDNLHPEFALDLNIKRSIFAAWQEYQGLGLLGGMGHASDLIRQLFLLVLSCVLPMEFLRYFMTILTLFIGALGGYILIKSLIPYENGRKEVVATLGGLFYLLNIATIQTYYVAFEAFTSHYASLPWLLFGTLSFIKYHNKKHLFIFSLIVLLSTPSGYIPTLFVAFLLSLTVIIGGLLIFAGKRLMLLKKALSAYALIFAINSFWVLPFLYFTTTSSSVNVNAKMNQMATETIFAQNKEFGDVASVIKLQGFWFNNVDPDLSGNFRYMLLPWIEHFNNPYVTASSYIVFAVIILGIVHVIKNKRPLHLAFLLLFFFAFTMLATNAIPFSWVVDLFRSFPLFEQAFRFPFTKFAILTSLTYSIFFSFGLILIIGLIKRTAQKLTVPIVALFALSLIIIISFPAFKGNLFYSKEQIKLPREYIHTFEFFKKQNPNQRIANFPQHTFWGWNFYSWGYGGSGFLWYGIKQPILDRAFDVWSDELENYYYELSQSLYAKNPEKVIQVLNKYQIKWLLVDRNVYSPFSPKAIHLDETEALLEKIPTVKKVQQFGSISIYSVKLTHEPKEYVFTTPLLPKVNGYTWGNDDIAYRNFGNYISSDNNTDTYFPFRSLFSSRTTKDIEYKSTVTNNTVAFTTKIPIMTNGKVLQIPVYTEKENFIPVEYFSEARGTETYLSVRLLTPELKLGSTTISKPPATLPVFIIPEELNGEYVINNNGFKEYAVNTKGEFSQKTYLSLKQDNVITLKNSTTGEIQVNVIPSSYLTSSTQDIPTSYKLTPQDSGKTITVILPKIEDGYFGYSFNSSDIPKGADCNAFRKGLINYSLSSDKNTLTITSVNDTACTSVSAPTLVHNMAYMISLSATNKSGRGLHFWVQNLDQKYAPIDTYLQKDSEDPMILAPMEDFGQGYSFHFENVSIGKTKEENVLKNIEILPLPYHFLTNITFSSDFAKSAPTVTFDTTHPNESLYHIQNIKTKENPFTLILSQSYDPGWQAYIPKLKIQNSKFKTGLFVAFPFIFGKEIKTHIKVNNWENGWEINSSIINHQSSIIIVYLPQYLQYAGFLATLVPFLIILGTYLGFVSKSYKRFNRYFEHQTNQLRLKMKK
ncbi:MAG: hypothetical protein Q7T54_05795 [Candidatus Levybacteria bacterium]|nr:hypothetical protein [Candidatus Levybacteria bacterium]